MNQAIGIGDINTKVIRHLLGNRGFSSGGLAINSTTNTFTITVGTKQTDDILTATVNGTEALAFTVVAGNANEAAVATAWAAVIDASSAVAASATGAVITVTATATTTAFTLTTAVTKASGTPTTTAVVAETIIGTKGIKTVNTLSYSIDGATVTKATTTNIAVGEATLPASSYRWYTVQGDASGNITTIGNANNTNWLPAPDAAKTIIGAVKIVTDSTHQFIPGTTALNAAGLTVTYFNLSCVPTAGYPA